MRWAILLALCAGCRIPATNIEAIPSVNYGQSIAGGVDGEYIGGGLTFVRRPPDPYEVAAYRTFPSPGGLGPDSDPVLAATLSPLGDPATWDWRPIRRDRLLQPAAEPSTGTQEHPSGDSSAIETPWGRVSLAALLAVLGTLTTLWGVRKVRNHNHDA